MIKSCLSFIRYKLIFLHPNYKKDKNTGVSFHIRLIMQKYLLINHLLISKTKVICISIIFYSSVTSRMCKSEVKVHLM